MNQSAPAPGIHRVLDNPVRLAAALRRSGWTVGRLSADPIADLGADPVADPGADPATARRELLTRIGRALDFPAYYGRNLDALEECLADLVAPTALLWSGWQTYAGTDPDGWQILLELFGERAERRPTFVLLLC